MDDAVTALPTPPPDRWRPTRAGLVNLWRYWDETFTFHRGRLLLRGPNGSGKSMALELLLPFLLDADSSPSRLTSAAKSRGSLYERIMTGTHDGGRTGFAWVEFTRVHDVFTVGVRLRASDATRKTDLDFFTTSLAVGVDLHLLDERRVPLSRKALIEQLGDQGRVHNSADEHRAAVREVLFPDFGPDRYSSVVTALLALRKEKLSQNLDLQKLSDVLSEALPAVDDHDVAVVAEGFERLDRRKSELLALEAELSEVKLLAARQRDYARAVVAAVAGDVRKAETRRDDVTRAEREARAALEQARDEAEEASREASALDERLAAIEIEVEALRDSDAYREGAALDDLRAEARRLRDLAERDRRTAAARLADREEALRLLDEADGARATALQNSDTAVGELRRTAAPAGAEAAATEALAAEPDEGERLINGWGRARRHSIAEVRRALEAHGTAVQRRTSEESRVAEDEETVDAHRSAWRSAVSALDEATKTHGRDVLAWAQSCSAVDSARVLAAIEAPPVDRDRVTRGVASLRSQVESGFAVARRDVEATRSIVHTDRAALADERDALAEGRVIEPVAPAWRRGRHDLAGAPLWRLLDTARGAEAGAADGLEAALLASGLLDAWVDPDGGIDLPGESCDLVVSPRMVEGRSLTEFLIALEASPVDHTVVNRVLASIAVAETALPDTPTLAARRTASVEAAIEGTAGEIAAGGEGGESAAAGDATEKQYGGGGARETDVVVGLDGTFRLGAAVGRGFVRPAELIGAEAQDRRRQARLAEINDEMATLDDRLAELARQAATLDTQSAAALADLEAVPDGAAIDAAAREAATAEVRFNEAERRLAASRRALAAAEEGVRTALRTLSIAAAREQLPTTLEGLAEMDVLVAAVERSAATWARRSRELAGAERQLRRAADNAERSSQAAKEAAANLAVTQADGAEVEVRLATLESSIGAEYRELLGRLEGLNGERRSGRQKQRDLADRRPQLERRVGSLETALREAESARAGADEERATAHRRFLAVVNDGMVADAAVRALPPDLEGLTAVLSAARAIAGELEQVASDEAAVERASARVDERLHHTRAAVGSRADLSREWASDGWWVLRAVTAGIRRAAPELASALGTELAEGRAELAADEERLFEQTLAGSVRQALATRIRLANQLVDRINRQLGTVRTAAGGVEVRLRWEVDPEQPDAVKAARSLLLRDPADLLEAERASLQEFVRARVDQARAELEVNAPWEARLRETLDYRSWHHFTLQVAHRDWDGFQPATPRRLQRLSTGERSVVLHLPMLAAVAAHYADEAGGSSGCPRLILLDELFAGVDAANRAQLFGTFTMWDLDAVFTSDHEWCQYATLDGIAIHHLHPADGDAPVTSTRFTWDGR
ncbi:MAG TPA: SbcC/MukB-like Walker B domain-containing protein, partial [Acidimicrobiales bacterium]|nr:SbcC/MukB-like Walker B domain-containing protein [Acidimicrobiales bacterium]